MTPNRPILAVNLQASYGRQPILHRVRLELQPGEILGLVGSSGAGKSTLVLALLGLLPFKGGTATGEVLLNGQNLLTLPECALRRLRGREIALIPQSPLSALNAAVTLRRHFQEAWRAHEPNKKALAPRLQQLLEDCQLPTDPTFLLRRPNQISVGQAQRVCIALALLHRPALLIADEPTSALDPVTQSEIVALLRRLSRRHNTTLLYVSHDLPSVIALAGRLAVLHQGTLVEQLPIAALPNATHPATLELLSALPVPAHILLHYAQLQPAQLEPAQPQPGTLPDLAFTPELEPAGAGNRSVP
jgi:peptide/nickel transport system ATP-binding protein